MKERRIYGFHPYAQLASIYAITGEFEKAEAIRDEGMLFPTRSYSLAPEDELQKARLEYIVLNMKAKYKDAEPFIRKAIFAATHHRQDMPHLVLEARIALIRNLANQNRFVEAEIEARQVVDKFSLVYGEKSTKQIYAMMVLSEVLLAQDRLIDAEKVCQASLKAYEQLSISPTLHYYLHSLNTLGKILMAKGDYSGAMMKYDLVLGMKDSNRYIYNNYYRRNHNVMLALIMTDRSAEAMELIESSYQDSKKLLGEKHSSSAGLLALRGMANNALGNLSSAYHDFAEAIPLIAKSKTYAENRLFNHRFTLIMESFLDLLTKLRGSPVEARLSISASAQAFETSTLLSDSAVQAAILASSSRMTIEDPALQELARTEQDLQQQITAYQNLIRDNLARPLGDSDRQGINNLKTMLDKAAGAREILVEEIHKRFPNYANLIDPRQPSLADVQSRLKPAEVIISICSAENSTYVFAITLSGPPEMFSVPVTRKKLDHLVSELKNSLYPGSDMLKQLPAYNFAKAYELYSLLLKPVEAVWKDSKHLILTASGPLSQLPFALLTTEPFQLSEEKEVLFSSYRNAPWLINQIFMTRVPSVSSFVALRERPGTVHAKRPFAGFGDPIFNQIQLAQASNETKLYGSMATTDKGKLDIRGIRLTNDGSLDNQKLTSCTLEMLERLPDTADELISIAEALGANPVQDVYLGPRASENQVKSIDLSDRRVVAFASHALVPYDLNGLDQPAIALSAPSVTGDEGDGLLTMAEILDLKLNADWVVLSACNTGAADGAGAEAVSGLGRAFFYAGTRSLLVSMWPVETTSAKKLTTSLFRHLKDNPGLTKAQAHQRAMLELIDGPGMIDEDGRTIASYAHPFFWAPFIVVGDNGMGHLN
jgi:CHAT domain-containing protein